jgi:hypothetical protein
VSPLDILSQQQSKRFPNQESCVLTACKENFLKLIEPYREKYQLKTMPKPLIISKDFSKTKKIFTL